MFFYGIETRGGSARAYLGLKPEAWATALPQIVTDSHRMRLGPGVAAGGRCAAAEFGRSWGIEGRGGGGSAFLGLKPEAWECGQLSSVPWAKPAALGVAVPRAKPRGIGVPLACVLSLSP